MIPISEEGKRLAINKSDGSLWEETFRRSRPTEIIRAEQILYPLTEKAVKISDLIFFKIKLNEDRLKVNLVQAVSWFAGAEEDKPAVRLGNEMIINLKSGLIMGTPPRNNSLIISSWLVPKRPVMDRTSFWAEMREIPIQTDEFSGMGNRHEEMMRTMLTKYNRQIRVIVMIEIDKQKEGNEAHLLRADLITRSLKINLRDEYEEDWEA